MSQCNVDFFDLYTMNNVHHDVIDIPDIDDDRLSLVSSQITISATYNVSKYNVIRIYGDVDFFGIVCESPSTNNYETVLDIKPFCFIFDHEVMFETGYQKNGKYASTKYGLESYIANVIKQYHIDTRDDDPQVEAHTLTFSDGLESNHSLYTTEWNLGLQPMNDNNSLCITNLYSDVCVKALERYAISVEAFPDFTNKKIVISIKPGNTSTLNIDADDPNVTIDTFYVESASSEVNKLEIWNTENQNEVRYYYLYTDKTHGTDKNPTTKQRISPVVTSVKTASPTSGSSDSENNKTFVQAADELAESEFENINWNNLIELTVFKNDPKIKPMDIPIGQQVNIVHNGYSYSSILTGRKIGDMITLCFGTIRVDLTKQLTMK